MAPADHVIVLFGATGDLAKRKLLPGLHRLCQLGLMPQDFRIIGASRRAETDEQFRAFAREAIDEFGHEADGPDCWDRFGPALSFVSTGSGFGDVSNRIAQAKTEVGEDSRVLFYLALPPAATADVIEQIGAQGLAGGARVIFEKPFGTDLASARELNSRVHRVFDDSQVFRIDHYAGREAVQNLLAVRFANGMLEPIWNREHIDHIQIDVPETLAIGMRASFYENTGAFRDMVVTHLFQVLGFVAMEPPTSFEAKNLIAEKTKVFESMAPLDPADVVRGQYDGYREIDGVAPDSDTETFVALRMAIDNWRWEGVPFYLRTGKKMAESHHQMTVAFKAPPRQMFPVDARYSVEQFGRDHLTFELGDPPSISMSFLAKVPGPTIKLGQAHMKFSYQESLGGPEQALDAYERLIYDVMLGDPTLFNTAEGIERLWDVSAPVLEQPPPLHAYEQGSWGPEASNELIAPRHWHLPGTHT